MELLLLPARSSRFYVGMLCALPLVAVVAPRFMGLAPSLIAVIGLALFYAAHRQWPLITRRGLFWAALFPALMMVSSLWSIDPETSFMRGVKTLPITLSAPVLWSLAKYLDEKSLKLFQKIFPLVTVVAALICILELYANAPIYHLLHEWFHPEKKFRLSQLNRTIVVIMLCGLAGFFCFKEREIGKKAFFAAVIILVIVATKSQSAQLGLILAVLFYAAFPYKARWAWPALFSIIAVFMMATPWLAQTLFHAVADDVAQFSWLSRSYANQRLEIWDFVSRRALERPLLGHGAEAVRVITDFDSAKRFWPSTQVLHPHNFAVQIWLEFACLGAVLTSLFFGDLLRQMQKIEPARARAMLPLFIASLSVATTGYGLWQGWWLGMFCLLFGYAAVLAQINNSVKIGQS